VKTTQLVSVTVALHVKEQHGGFFAPPPAKHFVDMRPTKIFTATICKQVD
jgi:hypothetical protein